MTAAVADLAALKAALEAEEHFAQSAPENWRLSRVPNGNGQRYFVAKREDGHWTSYESAYDLHTLIDRVQRRPSRTERKSADAT